MPINLYFDKIFAVNGDKLAVPDASQPDGSVSYDQGYTSDYELPIGNINRKVIPRDSDNQLKYDLTAAIQQLQQDSAPPFITTAMNGGSAHSYSKNKRVISGGVIYQSLTDANTTIPPGANWTTALPIVTTGTSLLKGDGSGGISNATAGTDYLAPSGSGAALTGITASQISGLIFSAAFTSSAQTITAAGTFTIAHGLGSAPSLVQTRLICITAESGYSIGNVLILGNSDLAENANSISGAAVVPDASNIFVRYGSRANTYAAPDKSTGGIANLTNANWNLIIKAWK